MMSIGDFARIGQVSVRMLRHYDQLGLIRPAVVDPSSGYRSYDPEQLARLHRVIALKDLGFTLAEVASILDDDLSGEQLRGMLRMRQTQLVAEQAAATARLFDVEFRLRLIEKENTMTTNDPVIKTLPARRLLAEAVVLAGQHEVGAAIGPIFGRTAAAIESAGGTPEVPVALYEVDDEGRLHLTAGFEYAGVAPAGTEIVDLPPVERAMCLVHLGEMATISASWAALHTAIGEQGLTPSAVCREIYVRSLPLEDQSEWVTELQQPVDGPTGTGTGTGSTTTD